MRTDLILSINQITRQLVALARQHQCTLAALDEPLAKTFADEANLVELGR